MPSRSHVLGTVLTHITSEVQLVSDQIYPASIRILRGERSSQLELTDKW